MIEPSADANSRRISPAEDRRVRHPTGDLLEPKSAVTWSPYWQRRLDDGDVVEHAPKAAAKSEKD